MEPETVAASRRGWRAGLIAGAAGMAALVGVAGTAKWGIRSNLSGPQSKEKRVQIVPSFHACSKAGENCFSINQAHPPTNHGWRLDLVKRWGTISGTLGATETASTGRRVRL